MLGNYEKRYFENGEKVWIGHYRNLANVLHWHFECELIHISQGKAQIKIGDCVFDSESGDSFFCSGEDPHYIISEPETQADIMIFDKSIVKDITDKYSLLSPKLPERLCVNQYFRQIEAVLSEKGIFYREAAENHAKGLILDIFRNCEFTKREDKALFYKNLISKINEDFSFITFEDAVAYSGYSPSHFSKLFKRLSGMNFSEYLNIIKVENALLMMRENPNITMTSVSLKCGFSTVRNFNRVFKSITGYSPRTMPKDFFMDTSLRISKETDFDPTVASELL